MLITYQYYDKIDNKIVFTCQAKNIKEAHKMFASETGAEYKNLKNILLFPSNMNNGTIDDPIIVICKSCGSDEFIRPHGALVYCVVCFQSHNYDFQVGLWYSFSNTYTNAYYEYIYKCGDTGLDVNNRISKLRKKHKDEK